MLIKYLDSSQIAHTKLFRFVVGFTYYDSVKLLHFLQTYFFTALYIV